MKFNVSEEYIQLIIEQHKNEIKTSNNFVFDSLFSKPPNIEDKSKKFATISTSCENFGHLCRNIIYYPSGGGMGWHTNENSTGNKRIYFAWSSNGDSGMNWYNQEDDKVEVDKDNPGWNIRIFDIPQWHCVWSKCDRISFGFDIS